MTNLTQEIVGRCEKDGWHYRLMKEVGTNRAVFEYGDYELVFQFDLFCEVGAPFQPTFQKLLNENGLTTSFDETGVFDRLVPMKTVTGYYSLFGYRIEMNDEEVYSAGNHPLDSQAITRHGDGLSLIALRKYCEDTAKEVAAEQGAEFVGVFEDEENME